jgi:hypothetical protein
MDDSQINSCIQKMNRAALVVIILLLLCAGKRRRHYLTSICIPPVASSAWTVLFRAQNNKGLINITGFDFPVFSLLLRHFQLYCQYRTGTGPGRRDGLPPSAKLGVVLTYLKGRASCH